MAFCIFLITCVASVSPIAFVVLMMYIIIIKSQFLLTVSRLVGACEAHQCLNLTIEIGLTGRPLLVCTTVQQSTPP